MTPLYTLAIFTSAFLLFLIQPMISKLLLPHLGGTPALWNTSMMFFQAMLLLGYAYAHLTGKWLKPRKQAWLHLLLVIAALAWLPIAARTDIGFASVEHPVSWILLSLLLSVGVPFFVLAANAPLLQSWLAHTRHKDAANPYFLYSASNTGSLLALFCYPLLVEPALTLPGQAKLWSALFVLFILLLAGCVHTLRKYYAPASAPAAGEAQNAPAPALKEKLYWVALAFCPSSLLLGVTTYITMDIASLPLFWVIPLALYLLTFILAFARTPLAVDKALEAQILLVPLTALAILSRINHAGSILILHLLTFFVLALGCHGTLARRKPDPRHLTEYYLWISFGGMLGGVFNALVAPQLFTGLVEYPLVLCLTLLSRPVRKLYPRPAREARLDLLVPAALCAGLAVLLYGGGALGFAAWLKNQPNFDTILGWLAVLACILITMLSAATAARPVRFALSFLALFLIVPLATAPAGLLYAERNFFGVSRVSRQPQSQSILLMHGTTLHGQQSLKEDDRLELTTYYHVLGDVFARLAPPLRSQPVAVLGLGAGTVACLGHRGQDFDFYEIDPAIAAIASNPDYFTFLQDCPPESHIHLGDGRLEIAKAPAGAYGFIIVDTFSSDAIPVHIITREALAIYKDRLAEGGILAFNISNRHLNLIPLLSAMAEDGGFYALLKSDAQPEGRLSTPSVWVVMARQETDFNGLGQAGLGWQVLENTDNFRVWTDNYSDIIETLF